MKKVRNIRWHTVLTDTLKTETSNFVFSPSLHWKPVECSQQCCCLCMPGLTEDKSGCDNLANGMSALQDNISLNKHQALGVCVKMKVL